MRVKPQKIKDKEDTLKAAKSRVLKGNDNQTDSQLLSGTYGGRNQ